MSATESSKGDTKTLSCPGSSNFILQEIVLSMRSTPAAKNSLFESITESSSISSKIADEINNDDASFESIMSLIERLQPPPNSPPKKKVTKEDSSIIPSERYGCESCQHKEEMPISSQSYTWYSCNDFGTTAIPPQKAEAEKVFSPFRPLGPSRI